MRQRPSRPAAPLPPPRLSPAGRRDHALSSLTGAVAELIRLSVERPIVTARQLELLRTRRHQLSAIIDRLARASGRGP